MPRRSGPVMGDVHLAPKIGVGSECAGQRTQRHAAEFVVPAATVLPGLHDYQLGAAG